MAARIDEFKAARDEAQNRTQQQQQQHASNGSSHAHANGHGTSAEYGRAGHARATGGAGGTSSSAAGSGGQPSGMGGSHRQQADAGPRKRHSHADKPVIDENAVRGGGGCGGWELVGTLCVGESYGASNVAGHRCCIKVGEVGSWSALLWQLCMGKCACAWNVFIGAYPLAPV